MSQAIILILLSSHFANADSAVLRQFKQLTFSPVSPAAGEGFSDPSLPTFINPHQLSITGNGVLTWKATDDAGAWKSFLSGERPTWSPVILYHSDAVTPFDIPTYGEEAWDLTVEPLETGLTVYGGAMTTQKGKLHARFPDENWSRRTYAFNLVGDRWVQSKHALMFDPAVYGWFGHNYGHQFVRDASFQKWMFYERVSEVIDNGPGKTELFMRKVLSDTELDSDENEIQIFKIGNPPYPATIRGPNNVLAEGPRPFQAELEGKTFYFVSFSSSEWDSDLYGMNLLWSTSFTGPYQPFLTADGKDLKNFGAALAETHHLTWGPGRGSFFQDPDGQWWVIFHATDQSTAARIGLRNLYLAPVKISLSNDGTPQVQILENDSRD